MNAEAAAIIAQLGLVPLPQEGGFFRQTWLGAEKLANGRAAAGAIYFLLTPQDFSALHRLVIPELWHFYAGDPVEHTQLGPKPPNVASTTLGPNVLAGHIPQLLVPAGVWQGARLAIGWNHGWALVGTTTSPAWTEADFEPGRRGELLRDFPALGTLIAALTR